MKDRLNNACRFFNIITRQPTLFDKVNSRELAGSGAVVAVLAY
jgi:hypothetical protein